MSQFKEKLGSYFGTRRLERLATLNPETKLTLSLLRKSPLAIAGISMVLLFVLIVIFGPYVTPYDPYKLDLSSRFLPPSPAHLFGTDGEGRDIFSRVLYGARYSFAAGMVPVFSAVVMGVILGALAGFKGGKIEDLLMRITDMFLAFPSTILAMAIAAGLGPSLTNAMIAMVVVWWPSYARLVRGNVLSVKETEYIEAARATGETDLNLIFRYVLPNVLSPIIVMATLDIGGAILTAAGLSFIGLGAQPPIPEWGAMVNAARIYALEYWWLPTFPGLAILVAVLGFNLFGDGLRDVLDPRLRRV
jgi:peptide/nickel transport system permease protein